jgi:glycosidase
LEFFVDNLNRSLIQESSYGTVQTISADEFLRTLIDLLTWYPREVTYAQLNLLDSHDTARWLSIARGDVSTLKLALFTMFCYVGAPMIYYGDEILMEGDKDPDCRRGMIWEFSTAARAMIEYIKQLTTLRKKYVALRRGALTQLHANGKVLAFARHQPGAETILVALNAGRAPVTLDLRVDALLDNGATIVNEWTGEQLIVQDGFLCGVEIPAREGCVWRMANSI